MPCLFAHNNFSHLSLVLGFLPIIYFTSFDIIGPFMSDSSDDLLSTDTLSLVSSRNVVVGVCWMNCRVKLKTLTWSS